MHNQMRIIQTVEEMRAFSQFNRRCDKTIGFVPTMGNLHQGHLTLVEQSHKCSDCTVVSVFVNPMQFGANEDIKNYPRTFEEDIKKLEKLNVDAVFFPSNNEIYPQTDRRHTQIWVPDISEDLCGKFRPEHFVGVATIVAKLFSIVQPSIALFGKKDFQQFLIIKTMVVDLCMPITLIGLETIRETDGLAMSSRNCYLSNSERSKASLLYRELNHVKKCIQQGNSEYQELERYGYNALIEHGFRPDYFAIRDVCHLVEPTEETTEIVVLTAAWLGNTRLIDNVQVSIRSR